jgi:hypothetical protein
MGALTEHHRCPRGPFHRLFDALSTVALGALIGTVVLYVVFDEHPVPALVLAAATLGAVLTSAVRQAVSGAR